ncbi:MAG: acylphosphatase [Ginsengibacter sp.]
MTTLHILITGSVQGVFYRLSAKKKAIQTGITGWVKNTPEGNVEIIACGPIIQLREFVEWCEKGPAKARVDKVITEDTTAQIFTEFKILH